MEKKQKRNEYNEESISLLKGADRVRKRPAVIFGSDGLEGCQHSFFEILSNSVDEAREGYGKEITVTVCADGSYEVEDRGRGIPLGYNPKEKRYNWELVFCELYAGSKYDNNGANAMYEYSLGTNGLGACATQYSSEFMNVKSYNGKTLSEISFKKGEPASELSVSELSKKEARTGTVIKWKPDLDVFTDIAIPREYFTEVLSRQAVINAGIRFVLRFEKKSGEYDTFEYYYENGINDYLAELGGEHMITSPVHWSFETSGRDREDLPEYKLKAEIAFVFTSYDAKNETEVAALEYYHNSSYLVHGGSPAKAVEKSFTYFMNKYLKNKGLLKQNEKDVTFDDIKESLVLVTNSFSTATSYENQTKKAITNLFIEKAMNEYIRRNLEVYFIENPHEAEKISAQVLANKQTREKQIAAKRNEKKKPVAPINIANRVEKYVDCRSKDSEIRELYIVEGDSALTSVKLGRDSEFQAIIPVRGKILNCLKSTYSKIFESPIITDLLKVIGCGVEYTERVKSDLPHFDPENFKWSKVIICTDADEDGFQIRTLILALFYRLLPTLIDEGRIYIAESPLFEITCKDDTYFAYNEQEKLDILAKLEGKKVKIQRSKGLGENEPSMMWQTTMNPETRRLIKVTKASAAETLVVFETLLGDDLPARKQYIADHGSEYIAMATD